MITKKNISRLFYIFLSSHLILWTLIPSISNVNLPLDTIEALAWASNLDWGFNKHPPLSAFAVQLFYLIFGSNDWAYYLLSQIFIIVGFIYVWKFSLEFFSDKIFALISILLLEGIIFYNFTTPEFNVNVSQVPFWALSVYYFWKSIEKNKLFYWTLFGIFSALGFLSKYLFVYIQIAFLFFLAFDYKKNKVFLKNYLYSIFITLIILTPHIFWLFENEFMTINYALARSSMTELVLINHIINPTIFIFKQIIILLPFFLMLLFLTNKFHLSLNLKSKKTLFLVVVCLGPLLFIFLTSIITGAKIRTMWMTPFYLFLGTFFLHILKKNIVLKNLKKFNFLFIILFFISPAIYLGISLLDETKRTDYPGKEISRLVQNKWDDNFVNEIKIVIGDEWSAGNLSYHLRSRPSWKNELKKIHKINDDQGVIYTGNPEVLKKICPGVFGTIKPVGYCMIGKR